MRLTFQAEQGDVGGCLTGFVLGWSRLPVSRPRTLPQPLMACSNQCLERPVQAEPSLKSLTSHDSSRGWEEMNSQSHGFGLRRG
jgi:hypothetical protein